MSNLLARRNIFVSGELIRASEWSSELEQLYQFLTGLLSGKIIVNQDYGNSVGLNDVNGINLVFRNRAAISPQGNFVEFKTGNVSKLKVISGKQIQSLFTDVAPIDVVSTTKVTNLNVQYLDGIALAGFFLTGKIVENYISFYFEGIPTTSSEVYRFITPAGTSMSIREFKVSSAVRTGAGSYPSNDAIATIDLKKNGVAIDTATLQQSSFSYINSTLNVGLVENDVVSVHITSNNGTDKCRNISAKAKFRQTLVS